MHAAPSDSAVLPPRLPAGLPWVGQGLEYRKDPLGFFLRYADRGAVVRTRFVGTGIYLLNTSDAIEHVLVKNFRNYPKDAFQKRALESVVGQGLFTSHGDVWLRLRRMMQPAFHKNLLAAHGSVAVKAANTWLASRREGEAFDAYTEMMALTLDVVAGTLFGANLSAQARELGRAMEVVMLHAQFLFDTPIPLPAWLPTPGQRRFRTGLRALHAVVDDVVERRRKQGASGDDLLGLLLEAQAEDGEHLTDAQLRDECLTLMIAGHETTAAALALSLWLLARHPEAEATLRRELATVLGGREPTVADLPSLPYCEQVVKESLRLYPPAWGMSRVAEADDRMDGVHVPAGTVVAWSQWALHRDARYFPEPEAFRPERWADGLERRIPRFAWCPFGGGPRLCIGAGSALMVIRLVLATVLQRFHFDAAPGPAPEVLPAITLRPKGGIPLTPRNVSLRE
ncbi:cytochrome P450 [Corallococcus carmarthensis]|uniref:Cytochrome P450 n=1 Tax=Corallococcus carmarthensis TaxID=2316728 RepID=A0A3A8KF53_9BACT|nr:cytochrome P450 [Corallococcus carmarthensis]RKH06773.1 cytochrome P450 [Corallococcus carmarthensis]